MYQPFSLLGIDTDIRNGQIVLEFNNALDENKKDEIAINIYERYNKINIIFDYAINQNKLIISLIDDPIPNTDYILKIKNIKSILDESLPTAINTKINFKSNVISTLKILSPIQFQEVEKLEIDLEEVANNNEDYINSYLVQISTDTSFNNIINSFITKDLRTSIYLKNPGQYFIRARIQQDESNYSKWTETVTFIKTGIIENSNIEEPDKSVEVDFEEDDEPIIDFDDEFDLEEYPQQGVTPEESLLLFFNRDIDDMSVDKILVIKEAIK